MVRFGTLDTSNPTMFQINTDMFGPWLGFRYIIPNLTISQINMMCLEHAKFNTPGAQTDHAPDMSMLIWIIASFGTYDTKSDYVPN